MRRIHGIPKDTFKKCVSVLLSLLLVAGGFPTQAIAEMVAETSGIDGVEDYAAIEATHDKDGIEAVNEEDNSSSLSSVFEGEDEGFEMPPDGDGNGEESIVSNNSESTPTDSESSDFLDSDVDDDSQVLSGPDDNSSMFENMGGQKTLTDEQDSSLKDLAQKAAEEMRVAADLREDLAGESEDIRLISTMFDVTVSNVTCEIDGQGDPSFLVADPESTEASYRELAVLDGKDAVPTFTSFRELMGYDTAPTSILRVFVLVATELDVKCLVIGSDSDVEPWLLVRMGEAWYHVDPFGAVRDLNVLRQNDNADSEASAWEKRARSAAHSWLLISDSSIASKDESRFSWSALDDEVDELPKADADYVWKNVESFDAESDGVGLEEAVEQESIDGASAKSEDHDEAVLGDEPIDVSEEEVVVLSDSAGETKETQYYISSRIPVQLYTGEPLTPDPVFYGGEALVEGIDYDITYTNNVNPGVASATITYTGHYSGTETDTFVITANPIDISSASVCEIYPFYPTGEPICPVPDLWYDREAGYGKELVFVENFDYDLSYTNNAQAGTARIIFTGKGACYGRKIVEFEITDDPSAFDTYFGWFMLHSTNSPYAYDRTEDGGLKYKYSGEAYTPTLVRVGKPNINHKWRVWDENVFTVSGYRYENNVNVGTGAVIATGVVGWEKRYTLIITPAEMSDVEIAEVPSQTYTGNAITPTIQITYNGMNLVEGSDYEVTTTSPCVNAGNHTLSVTGKGNYTGTKSISFTISPKSLSSCTMTLSPSSYEYDGTQKTPTLTVKDGSKVLVKGTDYLVTKTPSGRTEEGTYTYEVTGKGNYEGTKSASFTITASSALGLNDLSFNFSNSRGAFGYTNPYRIPLESYRIIFGEALAQYWYRYDDTWGGNCHGMSAVSRMLNTPGSGLTVKGFKASANRVRDLAPSDKNASTGRTLTRYIEAMQVSQYDSSIQSARRATEDNLDGLCNAVLQSKETGRLVDIGVYGRVGFGIAGHSIVGYDVQKVSNTQKRLYVYDCNFPNQTRYITISTNSSGRATGWYYHLNDLYDWGSSYSGSHINYTPYSAIQSVWNNGGGTHITNTLATNSQSFDVEDAEGNVIAQVRDGELKESSEGVWQYTRTAITADGPEDGEGNNVLLYMPSDAAYSFSNNDTNIGQLDVGMANEEQSAIVTTDASEVTFAVNDNEEVNLVDIDAGAGETYSVKLLSDLSSVTGQESIEFSGIGNGEKLSVGTLSGSCVIVNGKSATLMVNGEPVDIGTRLTLEPSDVNIEYSSCDYDGKAHEPKVSATHNGTELVEERDFAVKYSNNVEPGTATVSVYGLGDYDGRVGLTFKIKPPQTITASNKTVAMGKTVNLGAKASGDGKLTYKSSNTAVAKVSATGAVTPVKVGTVKITISAAGDANHAPATKTVTVTVTKGAQSITASNKTVAAGGTVSLGAKASGGGKLTYKSSNTKVATVDSKGVVTGKGVGTATITVTAAATPDYNTATRKVTVTVTGAPSVSYRTHVQNVGWQAYVKDGAMSGTSGMAYRLEGINIKLSSKPVTGGITYRTHVQNIGWQGWRSDGAMSGTSGKALRLEAIQIKLTGEMAKRYDVYYRVHCQNIGWMGWAKNGQSAGSAGYGYRLEGIQVVIVPKGAKAPANTYKGIKANTNQAFRQR